MRKENLKIKKIKGYVYYCIDKRTCYPNARDRIRVILEDGRCFERIHGLQTNYYKIPRRSNFKKTRSVMNGFDLAVNLKSFYLGRIVWGEYK